MLNAVQEVRKFGYLVKFIKFSSFVCTLLLYFMMNGMRIINLANEFVADIKGSNHTAMVRQRGTTTCRCDTSRNVSARAPPLCTVWIDDIAL